MDFRGFILQLDQMGVTEVILPFMLIFTIVYAVFSKAEILGPNKKNMNMAIALILGLSVVIPHVTGSYPPNADIVNIINSALPNVSVVVVAILMALLLIGVFGWKLGPGALSGWIALLCVGAIVYIFGAAANWWNGTLLASLNIDEGTKALLIVILVFGILIWFVTSEKKPYDANNTSARPSAMTQLNEMLGYRRP